MTISRREFNRLIGFLMGGWALGLSKPSYVEEMLQTPVAIRDFEAQPELVGGEGKFLNGSGADCGIPRFSITPSLWDWEICITPDSKNPLDEIGYFMDISPEAYIFDENKYSLLKRRIEPSEWNRDNRHLPIKIEQSVINKPGERSPQALKRVVEYTQFNNPRYVAAPGERVSLCNIAAWDWSRALQVHLPHWIGDTEMSANMLFRWISNSQAGGVYGEGWQPVEAVAAQLLANHGVPVFALVEHPVPGRHGHVAMVYPENMTSSADFDPADISFATVTNGRSRGGNGIKSLRDTFRWLTPTYFVHRDDFIVHQQF